MSIYEEKFHFFFQSGVVYELSFNEVLNQKLFSVITTIFKGKKYVFWSQGIKLNSHSKLIKRKKVKKNYQDVMGQRKKIYVWQKNNGKSYTQCINKSVW